MSATPSPLPFSGADGARLVAHCLGEGPPVLLLHGFLSNATVNWISPGIASAIAAAGFRVIAPDFRAHGASAAPAEAAAYPKDILTADIEAAIAHFQIGPTPLIGYSLGARIACRLLARGYQPSRLVLGGMGASGLVDVGPRMAHFADGIRNGALAANPKAGAAIQAFMAAHGMQREPALHALYSQVNTDAATLAGFTCPTLVVSGERDIDNGDPAELAALIPGARLIHTPGDHLSAVGKPAFCQALVDFVMEENR